MTTRPLAPTGRRILLRPREAAEELGISVNTLRDMANGGRLPAVRVGKQLRIPAAELDDWVDENRWFSGGRAA